MNQDRVDSTDVHKELSFPTCHFLSCSAGEDRAEVKAEQVLASQEAGTCLPSENLAGSTLDTSVASALSLVVRSSWAFAGPSEVAH